MSLHAISYSTGSMSYDQPRSEVTRTLADHLVMAEELLADLAMEPPPALPNPPTNDDFETLRWFPYSIDDARAPQHHQQRIAANTANKG